MLECDSVLAKMQDMLIGFQGDLGDISEEIRHLQEESLSMNIRLKNRREAETLLRHFLENSTISPEKADIILSSQVNEEFLLAVVDLKKKLSYLSLSRPPSDGSCATLVPGDTQAGKFLLPEMIRLKDKVIVKGRDYFVSQFTALRKPKTNVQVVQQSSLVKYAPLLQFIQEEDPNIGEDLRGLYVESMSRTLHNLFKCYYQQLVKLDLVMTTKHDLLVVEEGSIKSVFTQKVRIN